MRDYRVVNMNGYDISCWQAREARRKMDRLLEQANRMGYYEGLEFERQVRAQYEIERDGAMLHTQAPGLVLIDGSTETYLGRVSESSEGRKPFFAM